MKLDKKLQIRTQGLKEWPRKYKDYNRAESTPYSALKKFLKYYSFNENDRLIDFGSGKGRVAFYIHDKFDIDVLGIEAYDCIIDEALDNLKQYQKRENLSESEIRFKYSLAENYKIKKEDNKFFFFNPFSVNIYKLVLKNIIKSLDKHNREVDIILYYPMPTYTKLMRKYPQFEIHNRIKLEHDDSLEEFIIYRYNPKK